MKKLLQLSILLLVLVSVIYAGYQLGRNTGRREGQTQLIENYSFVREIAELASLEVNGVTIFKSTNLANDGSWTDALRKTFLENTVQLSLPYTAKYGVDLQDSLMRIARKDSVVEIHLPQPKLLSFELRLDRLEASSRKGWLLGPNDELYTQIQKKLYAQSRAQLETNEIYLKSSRERIERMMTQYFLPLHLHSICIFEPGSGVVNHPKG